MINQRPSFEIILIAYEFDDRGQRDSEQSLVIVIGENGLEGLNALNILHMHDRTLSSVEMPYCHVPQLTIKLFTCLPITC